MEVGRTLGLSEQPCSRWQRQCAGMGVVARRRQRQVEEENRTRKQLVADLRLDTPMLPEALRNHG